VCLQLIFDKIFRSNPHQHPLLYLKGVKFDLIVSVLNFMYSGEVYVAQADLNLFLLVAEDLKINGLSHKNVKQEHRSNLSDNSFNEPNQPTNQLEAVEENTEYIDDDRTGEEPAFVQLKTELDELDPLTEGKAVIEKDDLFLGSFGSEECFNQSTPSKSCKKFTCEKCGKRFKDTSHLRKHAETVHSAPYTCVRCGVIFTDKSEGLSHQRSCHFTCPFPECEAAFMHRGNFEKHQRGHLANVRRMNK